MTRILVVDGNKDFNHIFHALRQLEYELTIIRTPAECQKALGEVDFSLAFVSLSAENEPAIQSLSVIKKTKSSLPVLGLTSLSGGKLKRFLEGHNIDRNDFVDILLWPPHLESLIFAIEDSLVLRQKKVEEGPIGEKPLSPEERQRRLVIRRQPLEEQRLSNFISSYSYRDSFKYGS